MRKIRLTENQFNRLVSKCVKKALKETLVYRRYDDEKHQQMQDAWDEYEDTYPSGLFYPAHFNGNVYDHNTNTKSVAFDRQNWRTTPIETAELDDKFHYKPFYDNKGRLKG